MAERKPFAGHIDVVFDSDLADFCSETSSDSVIGTNLALLLALFHNRESIISLATKARELEGKWRSLGISKPTESSMAHDLKVANDILQNVIDHWDSEIKPTIEFTHVHWNRILRTFRFLQKHVPTLMYVLNGKANMKLQCKAFAHNISNDFCARRKISYSHHLNESSIGWPFGYQGYLKAVSGQAYNNRI